HVGLGRQGELAVVDPVDGPGTRVGGTEGVDQPLERRDLSTLAVEPDGADLDDPVVSRAQPRGFQVECDPGSSVAAHPLGPLLPFMIRDGGCLGPIGSGRAVSRFGSRAGGPGGRGGTPAPRMAPTGPSARPAPRPKP